jgi:cytidylate kinase
MSLVTVSAPYGAGGSVVAPALAERLGVPFVDRLIPVHVAARLTIPSDAALAHAEAATCGRLMQLLMTVGSLTQEYGTSGPPDDSPDRHACREATERVIHEHADRGRAVILGRAAALVLRGDPRALHVRLDGPRDARLRQAMRLEAIDLRTAEQRMEETDRARYAYVRRRRGADARDPTLYHLIIDSTAIDLAECVEIVAIAARTRAVLTDAARGGATDGVGSGSGQVAHR